MRKHIMQILFMLIFGAAVIGIPYIAQSDLLVIPNTFTPGAARTPASLNQNFTAVANVVNSLTCANFASGALCASKFTSDASSYTALIDTGDYYSATNVEGALAEIGILLNPKAGIKPGGKGYVVKFVGYAYDTAQAGVYVDIPAGLLTDSIIVSWGAFISATNTMEWPLHLNSGTFDADLSSATTTPLLGRNFEQFFATGTIQVDRTAIISSGNLPNEIFTEAIDLANKTYRVSLGVPFGSASGTIGFSAGWMTVYGY